jgi:hypothetical protein
MSTLHDQVFAALRTAGENGYHFENMKSWEIATDLITYDVDFEYMEIDQLVPIIEEWLST